MPTLKAGATATAVVRVDNFGYNSVFGLAVEILAHGATPTGAAFVQQVSIPYDGANNIAVTIGVPLLNGTYDAYVWIWEVISTPSGQLAGPIIKAKLFENVFSVTDAPDIDVSQQSLRDNVTNQIVSVLTRGDYPDPYAYPGYVPGGNPVYQRNRWSWNATPTKAGSIRIVGKIETYDVFSATYNAGANFPTGGNIQFSCPEYIQPGSKNLIVIYYWNDLAVKGFGVPVEVR